MQGAAWVSTMLPHGRLCRHPPSVAQALQHDGVLPSNSPNHKH